MTRLPEWQWGFVWELPCVGHIHVTIAELKWTASPHMDSAVGGVRVTTTAMLP